MRALAAVLCLAATAAVAAAPESSPRPVPRPSVMAERGAAEVARTRVETVAVRRNLVTLSPRPEIRPENLRRRATVRQAALQILPQGRIGGPLCGVQEIRGERLASIPGRISACGVAEPVRVTSVAGLRLSRPAIMDCPTAIALLRWTENGVAPAIGRLGGGPVGLRVAAGYACRTRNNQAGAKISEHGKARAIDISAIELRNGQALTVLNGWTHPQHGRRLRAMHSAACGVFGTVLGPGADGFHRDHFHLDTARYRKGSYCR